VVQVITHHLPTALTGFDLIIPIPLYPARFRFRGYNQADELARSLSLQLRIPVNSKILTKTHDNPPQARYNTRKQRLINLQQAFSINQPALRKKIKNKSIILLDDIATTGTTLRQAALPLKRAGAARVWGVVVAR
jgi:ComF family protein